MSDDAMHRVRNADRDFSVMEQHLGLLTVL
jgi:hypothetical protein